jgi:hypothetical protein
MIHDALCAGVGFLVGCFCPAIARRVKALFVKEGDAAKTAASNAAADAAKKL